MSEVVSVGLPVWVDYPDLAAEGVGGAAILCNDEFFAEKENLLKPAAAVWKEGLYTDRGKWMDGWETRRRREPGHDWCVVRLGMPGAIKGVVVDTAFFRGNFPEGVRITAAAIEDALDLRALDAAEWVEILPRATLRGDHKNAFEITDPHRYTHVKLEIFPDGGVARLRVHGEVLADWPRLRATGGLVDLAALEHGAVVETCSDMFFGSRNNLIKPGPSLSMADGWETRRRRGPGNDWAIVRLAAAGTLERVEIDTTHFKGNAPGRFLLEGTHVPSPRRSGQGTEVLASDVERSETYPRGDLAHATWHPVIESAAQAHRRHVYDGALRRIGPVTHLRLSVYPCGGVARLRCWGNLVPVDDTAAFNALSEDAARAGLARCCAATAWVDRVARLRPFEDGAAMARIAERAWWSLGEADWREAFAGHPKIGEARVPASGDAAWSGGEQRAAEGAAVTTAGELAALNARYAEAHGFIFITCAAGRSAEAMLAELRARVERPTADELRTAAEEQIKITRLRIAKLLAEAEGNHP